MTAPAPARSYSLGAVMPHVRRCAELVGPMFGIETILGWRATAIDMLGHPAGLALDFMCDPSTATKLNAYLLTNAGALGIKYTISLQTYYEPGKTGQPMEDRGSPTQNHMDHVHAQFRATGGDGTTPTSAGAGSTGSTGGDGGVFDGWAGDLLALGLKVTATGAALVLVVTGLRHTVKS